jgi:hypothetical protein
MSSATIFATAMRGWCSTTWPRPSPSAIGWPISDSGRRAAIGAPRPVIDCSWPEAIISASSIAVVCSASISSSE